VGTREAMEHTELIKNLNADLETEFQSIVQYVRHVAVITGAEFTSTVDELKVHIGQEVTHAQVLAEQVSFLGGDPSTHVPEADGSTNSRAALEADLRLETSQLERYRERVQQATELGLLDVAEALRPLLTQTQEHVRDLTSALGR
jgi:bacterioferritin